MRAEVSSFAHGRVNLIGEHTDYNGGFVLPTCIPQATQIQFAKREDDSVIARSRSFSGSDSQTTHRLGSESATGDWSDYLKGVTWILAREGADISGFECEIHSNVPMGSGLSSSAALEVALLKGLNELFRLDLDEVRMAQLGQRVENEFVGARVGIMDQMAASLGRIGEALFIDTRDLRYERLPLPLSEMELLVINSGVQHSHANGDYNQRRAECERACQLLGIRELRDFDIHNLARLDSLPELLRRRARHVVTENARVLEAVSALRAHDFARLGELFKLSHLSMRDDYEVSVREIDLLVELALRDSAVLGARLTGGGFGGSIVALVNPGSARQVGEKIRRAYSEQTGRQASILVPETETSSATSPRL